MNKTFTVGSLFTCHLTENYSETIRSNLLWKQTMFGCQVLNILQEILYFNMTYVNCEEALTDMDLLSELMYYNNASVDFYIRPLSLRSDVLELADPLHEMFDWNFGFTIYRPEVYVSDSNFYAKPFSKRLWYCLSIMAIFCSILFYFFKCWETRLLDGALWERSFGYELLMVIGAYCQHIPPIDAVLYSRRGAYLAFFLFAYLIYTYYTSNLLSYIVNDIDSNIDVVTILNSDLEFVILEDVMLIIMNTVASLHGANSELFQRIKRMKPVSILEGLKALKTGKVALLSDYITLIPFITSVFESHEACGLTDIDMTVSVKKFFFVSHSFQYKEEFKVALMRMEEVGIISRMTYYKKPKATCVPLPHVQTHLEQIILPLCLLMGTYALCLLIMVGEMLHFRRNTFWPYIE